MEIYRWGNYGVQVIQTLKKGGGWGSGGAAGLKK